MNENEKRVFFVQTEFTKSNICSFQALPSRSRIANYHHQSTRTTAAPKNDNLHHVNNNADAPVVHLSAVAHASDDLRRDVVRRADSRRRLRSTLQEPGYTKVCYLELSAFLVGHI